MVSGMIWLMELLHDRELDNGANELRVMYWRVYGTWL